MVWLSVIYCSTIVQECKKTIANLSPNNCQPIANRLLKASLYEKLGTVLLAVESTLYSY